MRLIVLWFCVFSAQANILFFDLNNASAEIEAMAKSESFKKQGKAIAILPSHQRLPQKTRTAIIEAKKHLDKVSLKAEECVGGIPPEKKAKCNAVFDDIRAAELKRAQLTGEYRLPEFQSELATLLYFNDRPIKFDTLVISGHHDLGYFRGEITQLEVAELKQLSLSEPELFAGFHTVILLGCSTGTPEMMQAYRDIFTHAKVIVGAEDNAPTRDEARNLKFIRELLQATPLLHKANSPKVAEGIYRGLLRHAWPASLLWNQSHYYAKDESLLLPQKVTLQP
ncbi:MAG: hypothetical protein RLZZ502_355 [Pseudomonadota bacterium]|jgi:hypothetical protein